MSNFAYTLSIPTYTQPLILCLAPLPSLPCYSKSCSYPFSAQTPFPYPFSIYPTNYPKHAPCIYVSEQLPNPETPSRYPFNKALPLPTPHTPMQPRYPF